MKRFIIPGGVLIGLFVIVGIVVGVEAFAAFVLNDFTEVASNVSCNVTAVETPKGVDPKLKMDCGGKEATTNNATVIVSYLQNPGPVTCTLFKTGSVTCEPRKKAG